MSGIQLLSQPVALQPLSSPQVTAKIEKSAKDFESILLGNWLQQAEQSFAKVPGTDAEEDDDQTTSQLQEGVAMQPLGEAMAASGGIGIAKIIARQLRNSESAPATSSKPAENHPSFTSLPQN